MKSTASLTREHVQYGSIATPVRRSARKGARLFLHYGDMTDGQSLSNLVLDLEPDEIYNLAAQSHVRVSFDKPLYTVDVTANDEFRGCSKRPGS